MVRPEAVNPPALGRPLGYAHGMRAGELLYVAGQVGGEPTDDGRHRMVSIDLVPQFERAVRNVLAVVAEAGGGPEHVVEMVVYVTDMEAYRSARSALADVWKRTMGRHYPAMTLVAVAELFEPEALVEIRAVAALG